MDNNNLQNQINELKVEMSKLKQSTLIPFETKKAFASAGFLNTTNFVVMGQTEVGAGGSTALVIPNATKYSMALAGYAEFPDSGAVDAYIESVGDGTYQLHLEGIALKRINYVVFLNNMVPVNVTN